MRTFTIVPVSFRLAPTMWEKGRWGRRDTRRVSRVDQMRPIPLRARSVYLHFLFASIFVSCSILATPSGSVDTEKMTVLNGLADRTGGRVED